MFNKRLNRVRLTLTAAAMGLASLAGPVLLPLSAHAATTTPRVTDWTTPAGGYIYYDYPEKLYLSGSSCNALTLTSYGFVTRNANALIGLYSLGGNAAGNPTFANNAWGYLDKYGSLWEDASMKVAAITISANGVGSPGYYVAEVYDDDAGMLIYSNPDYCS